MLWDSEFSIELKKYSCDCQIWFVDISDKGLTINPITLKSDKHLNLISPYKVTSDSHIQVMGIKEMIIK